MIHTLNTFHKTVLGYTLFAVISLALTFGFANLAIDSGSLLWYVLTLVFLVAALQNLVKLGDHLLRPKNVRRTQR